MRPLVVAAIVVALAAPAAASGGTTRLDRHGTVVLDGRKTFPIVLGKGPPAAGLAEVRAAGVNVLKIGPAAEWSDDDVLAAVESNRAAARHGLHTWVNLSSFAQARPGSWEDARLRYVVGTLQDDTSGRAIAMWKGADEPWINGIAPPSLRYPYCLLTGRGNRDWCAGSGPIDRGHLWVTVQAPRAGFWALAPYSSVTDLHGVNRYPVGHGAPDPSLDDVGWWTSELAAATPSRAVWTTLQICWRWSYDAGVVVLPTLEQQRFMIYDAIVNGARALAFYGGHNPRCWSELDAAGGWSWTFWERVLEPLVREIAARSPLAPALVKPATTRVLPTSDATVQAILRRGRNGDLWVLATRSGDGTAAVTIGGLPAWARRGDVYTENRSVTAARGSVVDTFDRWGVHVYRFRR